MRWRGKGVGSRQGYGELGAPGFYKAVSDTNTVPLDGFFFRYGFFIEGSLLPSRREGQLGKTTCVSRKKEE